MRLNQDLVIAEHDIIALHKEPVAWGSAHEEYESSTVFKSSNQNTHCAANAGNVLACCWTGAAKASPAEEDIPPVSPLARRRRHRRGRKTSLQSLRSLALARSALWPRLAVYLHGRATVTQAHLHAVVPSRLLFGRAIVRDAWWHSRKVLLPGNLLQTCPRSLGQSLFPALSRNYFLAQDYRNGPRTKFVECARPRKKDCESRD